MPPGLSDLVLDTQIRVEIHQTPHQIAHHRFTFDSGTLSGRYARRRERQHVWIQGRLLGRGSYGNVYLHSCSTGDRGETELQAVKTIDKAQMTAHRVNYHKEVEAIAKFSQQKVGRTLIKHIDYWLMFSSTTGSSSNFWDGTKMINQCLLPWNISSMEISALISNIHYPKTRPGQSHSSW